MGVYINKPKKNYNKKRESKDIDRKKRQKIYQTKMWEELRKSKLMEQPLCQICELQGIVKLANAVHHWHTFTKGQTQTEIEALAFDYNNLCSICDTCHNSIHHHELKGCKSLEDVKNRLIALGIITED